LQRSGLKFFLYRIFNHFIFPFRHGFFPPSCVPVQIRKLSIF
jgi:hypothetical protein